MKSRILFPLCAAALLPALAGCMRQPVTIQAYSKGGVSFSHSSDWAIEKDNAIPGTPNRYIQVKGPHSAMVAIIYLPAGDARTLEAFAASIAGKRKESLDNMLSVGTVKAGDSDVGTSGPVTASVSGHDLQGIHQHFTVTLLSIPVPSDAMFFVLQGTQHKALIMEQSATENLPDVKADMDMILDTLKIDTAP